MFRKSLVAVAALLLILAAALPAPAADLDLTVAKGVLERLFLAAAPYTFSYDLIPGVSGVDITLKNPRIMLSPGKPGRVRVEMDYSASSPLLKGAITGKANPLVNFKYAPDRRALKIHLEQFDLKLTDKVVVPLDDLIDPMYLDLSPQKPLKLGQSKIRILPKNLTTQVVPEGLRIQADYDFSKVE